MAHRKAGDIQGEKKKKKVEPMFCIYGFLGTDMIFLFTSLRCEFQDSWV